MNRNQKKWQARSGKSESGWITFLTRETNGEIGWWSLGRCLPTPSVTGNRRDTRRATPRAHAAQPALLFRCCPIYLPPSPSRFCSSRTQSDGSHRCPSQQKLAVFLRGYLIELEREWAESNRIEMEMGIPSNYRYMGRSYSDSGDCSGAFSDCNSDRSGEFPSYGSPTSSSSSSSGGGGLQRLLVACAADYSDEVVRGLISDLESPAATVESQRRAAMELRLLAKHNPENRLRIAAAGAVGPLVALLSHPDPLLQEHGVTAILNLSLCEENKALIAAAGAIRPLVRALRTGTPAARENAACALLRLAQLDDLRASIGRYGAIPPLVALLESSGPRGKKDAATALFTLLASRENKIRAVEAGIVRPLLDLMADPESGMVDKAAFVLHAVVEVAEGRAAAVEEYGVPVLVEMVETGTPRQKEIAVRSLFEICRESAIYRKMVAHEGAIPPLVALSQSGTKKAKEKAEALIELLRQPRTAGMSHY
ncbi:spotted leaf 11 [Musa troglodytarum]|uniref:RING-type E3 ubiquitin transferase n=1 Tax=Musa troglodytarum TaxID=320322 RepID=A0A9E7FW40_9LILI|nr:spotted leaf 11 [Musa troglodytarum]URE01044.1 spotted leaf 11 [Musa troglodytarum]